MGSVMRRRALALVGMMFFLARCSGSCSCVRPLDGPFPEDHKINQMVQARVTPTGFDFVNAQLPTVLSTFLKDSCGGDKGVPCEGSQTCTCTDPSGSCDTCPSSDKFCALQHPMQCVTPASHAPILG